MAEKTLADFARSIGISPATARQWKKRGKIVERDSGFELIAEISADGLKLSGVKSVTGVTLHSDVTGESVTPESVTPIAVAAARRDSVTPRANFGDGSGVTGVMRNSVTDSAQDSRLCGGGDSKGEMDPESHRESCVDAEAVRKWVLSGENFTIDQICTLRSDIAALQGEIGTLRGAVAVSNASLIESNNALIELQSLIADLRSRVTALEINAKRPELNAGDGSGHRYSIDPPSTGWGP